MKLLISTFFIIFLCASEGYIVRYDNYAVYQMIPQNVEDVSVLEDLQMNNIDVLSGIRGAGSPIQILVPPQKKDYIDDIIATHNITLKILTKNIQEQIDNEERSNNLLRKLYPNFNWKRYQTLEEIYDWLQLLAKRYPKLVTLIQGGSTYEGRKILGVKVSFNTKNEQRGVWIDSLIHAREWIAGATNTFILNQVLTSKDPAVRKVVERFDWYFFPVINPDGYVYTYTKNRRWRGTRTRYNSCYGADPNRNWDIKWRGGSPSQNFFGSCGELYPGPAPFSEIETRSLAAYIRTISKNLKVFITFHSFGQLAIIPYTFTSQHLENYNEVEKIVRKASKSLAVRYNTTYTVGTAATTVGYNAYGSSMDWVKATFKIPVVLCYELRPHRFSKHTFLLPENQIIPTGEETFDSIITLVQESEKII